MSRLPSIRDEDVEDAPKKPFVPPHLVGEQVSSLKPTSQVHRPLLSPCRTSPVCASASHRGTSYYSQSTLQVPVGEGDTQKYTINKMFIPVILAKQIQTQPACTSCYCPHMQPASAWHDMHMVRYRWHQRREIQACKPATVGPMVSSILHTL